MATPATSRPEPADDEPARPGDPAPGNAAAAPAPGARPGAGRKPARPPGALPRRRTGPLHVPPPPPADEAVHGPPQPLHGGPLTVVRFMRRHRMLTPKYAFLIARWAWLKLRWRGRLETDGLCFVAPRVKLEIGERGRVRLGRWSWVGHGTKI